MADIQGTAASEILLGTPETDQISGLGGDDHIEAGAGADTVNGGSGRDDLLGNKGADTVLGGSGDDRLIWTNGDGSDAMNGGNGRDAVAVFGNPDGDDTFQIEYGGTSSTFQRLDPGPFQLELTNVEALRVEGLGGNDSLAVGELSPQFTKVEFWGWDGNDVLSAASTATPIEARGGEGNDALTGGSGNDLLIGEAGDDVLTGGDGRDVFLVEPSEGADTIQDFVSGEDVIALRDLVATGGGPASWTDVSDAISETDTGDSVIDLSDFGEPATITVVGVTNLGQADFALI